MRRHGVLAGHPSPPCCRVRVTVGFHDLLYKLPVNGEQSNSDFTRSVHEFGADSMSGEREVRNVSERTVGVRLSQASRRVGQLKLNGYDSLKRVLRRHARAELIILSGEHPEA